MNLDFLVLTYLAKSRPCHTELICQPGLETKLLLQPPAGREVFCVVGYTSCLYSASPLNGPPCASACFELLMASSSGILSSLAMVTRVYSWSLCELSIWASESAPPQRAHV